MIEQLLPYLVIGGMFFYHFYSMKQVKEERKELVDKVVNALMAKNAQELRDLELAQNTEIKVETPKAPDLEPLENLNDEDHLKAIMGNLKMPKVESEE